MGPINYGDDAEDKLLPLTVCMEYYKKSVEPSDEVYNIDAEVETGETRHLFLPVCFLNELHFQFCVYKMARNITFSHALHSRIQINIAFNRFKKTTESFINMAPWKSKGLQTALTIRQKACIKTKAEESKHS